jgi:hypothetical protein
MENLLLGLPLEEASKKLTRTPKASRKAIRHRRRGTLDVVEILCVKSAPEGSLDGMVSNCAPWSTNFRDFATGT